MTNSHGSSSSLDIDSVSIVILSEGNNPRLLNPDFLKGNGIVPEDWEVKEVIVTPPIAKVAYTNDVEVIVEETKIQFSAKDTTKINWCGEMPRIANAYLSVLPHVNYTSAGLNLVAIRVISDEQDINKQLVSEMLKDGPWLQFAGGVTSTSIELNYGSSQPRLNLKIIVGEKLNKDKGNEKGFVFIGNYHHDFSSEDKDKRKEFISGLEKKSKELFNYLEQLPLK